MSHPGCGRGRTGPCSRTRGCFDVTHTHTRALSISISHTRAFCLSLASILFSLSFSLSLSMRPSFPQSHPLARSLSLDGCGGPGRTGRGSRT